MKIEFPNLPEFESNNINHNRYDEISLFEKDYPYELYKNNYRKKIVFYDLSWNEVIIKTNKILDRFILYKYHKDTFTWICTNNIIVIASATPYYKQFAIIIL